MWNLKVATFTESVKDAMSTLQGLKGPSVIMV